MKRNLGVVHYGRYVDDFYIVNRDKSFLLSLISKIREYLADTLELTLHPNKIYLQHIFNGVPFLGVFTKPHCLLMGHRIKSNLFMNFQRCNALTGRDRLNVGELEDVRAVLNSYFGIMQHINCFHLMHDLICKYGNVYRYGFYISVGGNCKYVCRSLSMDKACS